MKKIKEEKYPDIISVRTSEENVENDIPEDVEKKYRIKCKVCKKSFTTDLDPKTFKKFKCSKCGAVGKFEFKLIIKKEKKLPRDLKIDEIFRMFKIAKKKSLRDYKILNFLFYAAFRNEEMASLKKENINLNTWVIKVVLGKGGKDRYIPIIEIVPFIKEDYGEKTIYEKLTEWVSESKTGYIFEGNSALGNISDRQVRRIVKKYAQLAKIENYEEIHPHTLRHSYATYLHGVLGVPLESVQKVLGHIRIDTTLIYAHMTVEKARAEIIKRMKIAEMVRTVPIMLEKIAKEKNADKRIEMKVDLSIKLSMINLGIIQQ